MFHQELPCQPSFPIFIWASRVRFFMKWFNSLSQLLSNLYCKQAINVQFLFVNLHPPPPFLLLVSLSCLCWREERHVLVVWILLAPAFPQQLSPSTVSLSCGCKSCPSWSFHISFPILSLSRYRSFLWRSGDRRLVSWLVDEWLMEKMLSTAIYSKNPWTLQKKSNH